MKLPIKKSECVKDGAPLMIATKKRVQKKSLTNSAIQYCITVEPFPMSYAYADEMSHGDKFMCEIFSIN